MLVDKIDSMSSIFSVFPNPCNGEFFIRNNRQLSSANLYSIEGKLIDSFDVHGSKKITLSKAGMYILKTENGECYKIVNQN
jgi:hypothetical protein